MLWREKAYQKAELAEEPGNQKAANQMDLARALAREFRLFEPFCVCGRVISECDGSRRGCVKAPR